MASIHLVAFFNQSKTPHTPIAPSLILPIIVMSLSLKFRCLSCLCSSPCPSLIIPQDFLCIYSASKLSWVSQQYPRLFFLYPQTKSSPLLPPGVLFYPVPRMPGNKTVGTRNVTFHSFFLLMFCVHVLVAGALNEEGHVLLEFKGSLIDPDDNLHGWSSSDTSPCDWTGISCSNSEVTSINLHDLNLSGYLSPVVCSLPRLLELNVSKNLISGSIPEELASCYNLLTLDICTNKFHSELPVSLFNLSKFKKLSLCENYIYGEIPIEIGKLTLLEDLEIYSNNLSGSIPGSIRTLKRLRVIRAGLNFFSGPIPSEITECESLEILGLAQNRLEGSLPRELLKLHNLTSLILWQNFLSGEIPGEIGNLSKLELLALHENSLTGSIPREIGKLTRLQRLYLYRNVLNGSIPDEIGNCSNAVEIDLSENHLTGEIPNELGRISDLRLIHLFENKLQGSIPDVFGQLKQLQNLDLSINNLTGKIPIELQDLPNLIDLQLFDNNLEGTIPPLLGYNSHLSVLDISANKLVGSIPKHLCKYQNLMFLSLGSNKLTGNIPHGLKVCESLIQLMLGDNQLTGSLPTDVHKLQNLSSLELYQNRFSGPIPPETGNLSNLERLLLADNYFYGTIPVEIGNLVNLVAFNVSSNRLSGYVPRELGNCLRLQRLDLSRNKFSGALPEELGELVNLELLKLSDNIFSGLIPVSLGELRRLTELQMGGNFFTGTIPLEFGQLRALQIGLNLSHNNLTGTIPEALGKLQMLESLYLNDNKLVGEIPATIGNLQSLLVCNLSNNNLIGTVPDTSTFRRIDPSNFAGNRGLHGWDPEKSDPLARPVPKGGSNWMNAGSPRQKIVSLVALTTGFTSLIFIGGICWVIKRQGIKHLNEDQMKEPGIMIDNYYFPKEGFTYQELVEATRDFSESTIIGRGAYGTVYKAVMSDGTLIAVKKLKSRGEGASVDTSFRAEISTLGKIRHRNIVKLYGFCYHQDTSLLLYEYMKNGSLGEQLHSRGNSCLDDWNVRYRIALGAAEGLCYLHYDCKPRIIHRDIKSNNILLDEFLQAHVGDFGLAKLVDFPYSKSMSAVAGSYGYIAPEYAYTMKVTEKCDIYSFGVVLLELMTGQTPVQPLEQGGDLVSWVRRSVRDGVGMCEIFDKTLDLSSKRTIKEMSLIMKIALFCTSESPFNRPNMKEVISMMMDAREDSTNPPASPTSDEDAPLSTYWYVTKHP